MRKNEIILNEVLNKKYDLKFQDYTINFTNTTLFVLPMLNLSVIKLGKYFLNCFIADNDYHTIVERPLFLLFKFNHNSPEEELHCKNIHKQLIEKEEFVTYYYSGWVEDSNSIIYLFNIKEEFADDYQMYLNGKYSKFREEFKSKFPKFYVDPSTGRQQPTIVSQVLSKSKVLKKYWEDKIDVTLTDESEVWSSPDLTGIETI